MKICKNAWNYDFYIRIILQCKHKVFLHCLSFKCQPMTFVAKLLLSSKVQTLLSSLSFHCIWWGWNCPGQIIDCSDLKVKYYIKCQKEQPSAAKAVGKNFVAKIKWSYFSNNSQIKPLLLFALFWDVGFEISL